MMNKCLRQLIFLVCAFFLRWPIWLLIWIAGRSGMFKTLFLLYPTDSSECLDFCPDIQWLRNFLSGRPTPAGLIMDGWRPIGIYLVIPNQALELMRRKERATVECILRRMLWIQKLSGAGAIGLAGQLGSIFEKRHGIPMEPPFYSSTFGNIFSIQKAVNHLVVHAKKPPWQVSVAILGGGELGEQLEQYLRGDGYRMSMVDVRYTRAGDVKLTNAMAAGVQLKEVDLVINLLPRGKDFIDCNLHQLISETATIIDFSRPQICAATIAQNVVMGNRVRRGGLHFFMTLPGGWQRHDLPACSMPSLVASLSPLPLRNIEEFRLAASQLQFCTALSHVPARPQAILGEKSRALTSSFPLFSRFMLYMRSR
ncbi:hypothetical protein [uncultured Desulfobulbus sp.]|uniref:hypothetical protein n=1 Tax=uncultured Desulfobulbus sp. TaxID=239745 RepID=UPI0029C77F78|nr:hypothetical protein [uncultured Desulfobulbus sp.]